MKINPERIVTLSGNQLSYYQGKLKTRQSLRKIANYLIVKDKTGMPGELRVPCTIDGNPDYLTFLIIEEKEVI